MLEIFEGLIARGRGISEETMSESSQQQRRAAFMVTESLAQTALNARNRVTELFSRSELRAIDQWVAKQKDPLLNRPEAIRQLVDLALKTKA